MLKFQSVKILQKLQQKERSRQEITETKAFKVSKASKTRKSKSSNSPAEHSSPKTKAAVTLTKMKKDSKLRAQQVYRKKNNGNLTTSEEKLLQSMYTKWPAAFGSVQKLQRNTILQPRKVKQFLVTKNAHTKYIGFRKRFTLSKVVAYGIDEIRSLDLAHVDKMSKQNAGMKYLLIAVDYLSRYLRIEPLKSKYATTTTEFKGNFKTRHQKINIGIYQIFSKKETAFAERNIRSLRNNIYNYLE